MSGTNAPGDRSGRGRRRMLAHPVLSMTIAAVWLLLQGSLEPAQLLVAAALGLLIPRGLDRFLGAGTRLRRPAAVPRLALVVLWDIVVANVAVAAIVLNPRARPRPAWVRVPLDLQHPTGIVLLATIITTTPGTVSCVIDEVRGEILVHALDCDDPQSMAAQIKQRYERPLQEIFG